MSIRARLVAAAVLAVGILGLTGATGGIAGAAAPSAADCSSGVLASGTYNSLALLPGFCLIEPGSAVTITGPVTVPSGSVLVVGLTPEFSIGPASLTVTGPLRLSDASGILALAGSVHIGGPLTVGPNAMFEAPGSFEPQVTVGGGVTVESQGAFISGTLSPNGSAIGGPVRATDPSTIQISGSTVSGPITVTGGGGSNAVIDELPFSSPGYNTVWLAGNTILGPVNVQGFAGNFLMIGSPQPELGLGTSTGNSIGGSLTVSGHPLTGVPSESFPGFWDVNENTVSGNAKCSANGPDSNIGGFNVVSGHVNTCG
ncbi:MAG TPA: hypothetical protein VN203_24950 [Candidatus Acidoferrum sp.]|nr:hypothetical protein [Candidatus Acidoferrum sp.]